MFLSCFATAADKPQFRYKINSTNPRFNVVLYAYDLTGKGWPSYFMGKPNDGGHWIISNIAHPKDTKVKPSPPYAGHFHIEYSSAAQSSGDQSSRILGEAIIGGKPDLSIKLLSVGETRDLKIIHEADFSLVKKSKKYPDGFKIFSRTKAIVEVSSGGKSVKADAELRVKRNGRTTIRIEVFFKVQGKDLGFQKYPGEIGLRVYILATTK
ncbi:MAG: hypothetical protein HRT72_10915 [Flavobacteriales bacterium]|nr:hypothetical protein [Flavobacteriales bacterium]